jgi:hypothetical protein
MNAKYRYIDPSWTRRRLSTGVGDAWMSAKAGVIIWRKDLGVQSVCIVARETAKGSNQSRKTVYMRGM